MPFLKSSFIKPDFHSVHFYKEPKETIVIVSAKLSDLKEWALKIGVFLQNCILGTGKSAVRGMTCLSEEDSKPF